MVKASTYLTPPRRCIDIYGVGGGAVQIDA